jgi:thymidylate synthase
LDIYNSYDERVPDSQYQDMLRFVRDHGERTRTAPVVGGEEADAVTWIGYQNRFPLENGFPVITERSIERFWSNSIGELFAFINGVTTHEGLVEFGCRWWAPWVTPKKTAKRGLQPGELGPGSYGGAFHDFPMPGGQTFNQFEFLVRQIRDRPELRTHYVTPFVPFYTIRVQEWQQKVVVVPCHGLVHVRIIGDEMTLLMWQRSGDLVLGVPSNMVQYTALLLALAQVTGYKPKEFVHQISDAHIYTNHLGGVEEMLSRTPKAFPEVYITEPQTSLFDYRMEHFSLGQYEAHPPITDLGEVAV